MRTNPFVFFIHGAFIMMFEKRKMRNNVDMITFFRSFIQSFFTCKFLNFFHIPEQI